MTKWEYKYFGTSQRGSVEDQLNALGAEGWEIFHINEPTSSRAASGLARRPLPEQATPAPVPAAPEPPNAPITDIYIEARLEKLQEAIQSHKTVRERRRMKNFGADLNLMKHSRADLDLWRELTRDVYEDLYDKVGRLERAIIKHKTARLNKRSIPRDEDLALWSVLGAGV